MPGWIVRSLGSLFKTRAQEARAILQWLHEHPGWQYGLDISAGTGLGDGTIYPALAQLKRQGWIEEQWKEGTPRRRVYRVKSR